jgi:type I restriction enzyme S subunit
MNSEWKEVRLGDLISLRGGLAYKGEHISQSGTPMVTMGCVDPGSRFKREGLKYYRGSFGASHTAKSGDIVIATRDVTQKRETIGCPCLIPDDLGSEEAVVATNAYLVTNHSNIDNSFLYLLLKSPSYREQIVASAKGSTVIMITKDAIENHSFLLPPPVEQKAIAHILGTLGDKIELNRKTNETLEAMAKALFKSWFVDFDPVRAKAEGRPTGLPAEISDLFPDSFEDSELGEIPSGWNVGEIDQILNLQKDSLDPASAPDEAFDHYSIPAFDAGKYPAKELGSSIKSQKFLVGDGDLLVSKLNPSTPRVWIPFTSSGRRAICSTEFLVCRTSSVVGRAYTYCLASSDAIVEAMTGLAGGTSNSHQRIRPGDFLALPCCIGTEMVRSAFLDVVEPLLGKSLALRTESRSLSTTRDALLPKLISGEIRIPDAKKILEEVGV